MEELGLGLAWRGEAMVLRLAICRWSFLWEGAAVFTPLYTYSCHITLQPPPPYNIFMFKTLCIVIGLAVLGSYAGLVLYHYVPLLTIEMAENARNASQEDFVMLIGSTNSTKKLDHLTSLTKIPLVGPLFSEQKIVELTRLSQFEEAIAEAWRALESSFNVRSFSIWYHKALSECLLDQYEDCEASLSRASLYASRSTEPYV